MKLLRKYLLKFLLMVTANIYLFKVNDRNTRKRYDTCSKLTIKTVERRQWRCFDVVIVNFENISHFFCSVCIIDFEQINVSCAVRYFYDLFEIFKNNISLNFSRWLLLNFPYWRLKELTFYDNLIFKN